MWENPAQDLFLKGQTRLVMKNKLFKINFVTIVRSNWGFGSIWVKRCTSAAQSDHEYELVLKKIITF